MLCGEKKSEGERCPRNERSISRGKAAGYERGGAAAYARGGKKKSILERGKNINFSGTGIVPRGPDRTSVRRHRREGQRFILEKKGNLTADRKEDHFDRVSQLAE